MKITGCPFEVKHIAFDWETSLVPRWTGDTIPVAASMVAFELGHEVSWTPRVHVIEVLDKRETITFIVKALQDPEVIFWAWNLRFDGHINLLACNQEAEVILQAIHDGRFLCAMIQDQQIGIAQGTFGMRSYSLSAATYHYTGRTFASEDKGDGPVLGARGYKSAAGKRKLRWLQAMADAAIYRNRGEYGKAVNLFAEARAIQDFGGVPFRYLFGFLSGVPIAFWPSEALSYISQDAVSLAYIVQNQLPLIEAEDIPRTDYGHTYDLVRQSRHAIWAGVISDVGWFTRPEYAAKMRSYYEKLRAELLTGLDAMGLVTEVKSGVLKGQPGLSVEAVREVVRIYSLAYGYDLLYTPTGKIAVTEQILNELPGALPDAIKQFREATQFLRQHIPLLEQTKPKTVFDEFGIAITTRMKSGNSAKGEFQAHNLKKNLGVREGFRPPTQEEMLEIARRVRLPAVALKVIQDDTDFVFLIADYAQIELFTCAIRILYMLTGEAKYTPGVSQLADMLKAGEDIHSHMGLRIMAEREGTTPISYEEFRQRVKAGDPAAEEDRQQSKPIDFGTPGGAHGRRLALEAYRTYHTKYAKYANGAWDIKGSIAVATRLREQFLDLCPDVKLYLEKIQAQGDNQTAISVPDYSLRGDCTVSEAGNYGFQRSAASAIKQATANIMEVIYSPVDTPLSGSVIAGIVHDEIVMYVPRKKLAKAAKHVKLLMIKAKEELCPGLTSDKDVEPAAAYVYSKKAKPRYDDNGDLIPCAISDRSFNVSFPQTDGLKLSTYLYLDRLDAIARAEANAGSANTSVDIELEPIPEDNIGDWLDGGE